MDKAGSQLPTSSDPIGPIEPIKKLEPLPGQLDLFGDGDENDIASPVVGNRDKSSRSIVRIPSHRRDYESFLASKRLDVQPSGFDPGNGLLNPNFDGDFIWQNDVCKWALKRGRAGIFPTTGTGKTAIQLVIGNEIVNHTDGKFLLLAPLAVTRQTVNTEAPKFGISRVKIVASQVEVDAGGPGIYVTNYEKFLQDRFDPREFVGVGLDEAGVLKSLAGKTRDKVIHDFQRTPYRYAFTATPSPNDIMELGSYCEFLGIMTRSEMLAMFFTHDGGDTSKWRLKKHAEKAFFRWMATWAVMINNPEDIGYNGDRFKLPPLKYHIHTIESGPQDGYLFSMPAKTLGDQRASRRETISARVEAMASIVNATDEAWSIWCQLNDESKAASRAVQNCVEVTGSMKDWEKEQALVSYIDQRVKRLVSKAKIAGFGLNLQFCCKVALLGIDHSFESLYQLIRRHYRFGQLNQVDVHAFISDRDSEILTSMERKQKQHEKIVRGMVEAVSEYTKQEIHGAKRETRKYNPTKDLILPKWL